MSRVFQIWPSAADLAREIGENPITVRAWRRRGSIPADRDLALIEAARRRGEDLTLEELAAARRPRKRREVDDSLRQSSAARANGAAA